MWAEGRPGRLEVTEGGPSLLENAGTHAAPSWRHGQRKRHAYCPSRVPASGSPRSWPQDNVKAYSAPWPMALSPSKDRRKKVLPIVNRHKKLCPSEKPVYFYLGETE